MHDYLHAAAVVGSPAELLDTALAYVDEGLREGDLVLLGCSSEVAEAVRDGLGVRARALEWDGELRLFGVRPPDSLARARGFVVRAASSGSRLRYFGEVPPSSPVEWREGARYEAAVNLLLAGAPATMLCTYDASVHPAGLIDGVATTHPVLVVDGVPRPSPAFVEPYDYVRGLPVPREPVEDQPPVFAVDEAAGLVALRHALRAVLDEHVPDEEQRGDLYLAVSEVAANAFRHGSPPVSARVWTDGARLVCVVTDSGRTFDDPLAGYVPAHGMDLGRGGMGLWLARKLFDAVDLLPGERGLTVRLSAAVRPAPSGSLAVSS